MKVNNQIITFTLLSLTFWIPTPVLAQWKNFPFDPWMPSAGMNDRPPCPEYKTQPEHPMQRDCRMDNRPEPIRALPQEEVYNKPNVCEDLKKKRTRQEQNLWNTYCK